MAMVARATGHQEVRRSANERRHGSICGALPASVQSVDNPFEFRIGHVISSVLFD
jgi:hypothetical protein